MSDNSSATGMLKSNANLVLANQSQKLQMQNLSQSKSFQASFYRLFNPLCVYVKLEAHAKLRKSRFTSRTLDLPTEKVRCQSMFRVFPRASTWRLRPNQACRWRRLR